MPDRRWKSITAAILIAAMLLLLSACGKTEAVPAPEAVTAAPAPSAVAGQDPAPSPKPVETAVPAAPIPLEISEVMSSNKSTLLSDNGDFPDWIELHNRSSEPVSLSGLFLSDKQENRFLSPLPEVTVPGDGYVLVFADGGESTAQELHASFKLSQWETLYLSGPSGEQIDAAEIGELSADISLARINGVFRQAVFTTPGYENTGAGYCAFQAAQACSSPLQIAEVRVSDHGIGYNGREPHSDWVELTNASEAEIALSAYTLSDDADQPEKYRLPEITLAPGDCFLILCTDEDPRDFPLSGFSLNAERENLYLFRGAQIVDHVLLHDIPYAGSYGRLSGENGFFYFEQPTFNQPNGGKAARMISEPPAASSNDGVFENCETVTVELNGEGTIYYTLDGSLPNESSQVYTGPFQVHETTVVRAVAVQADALKSPALTLSYIINEGHTLPVVSVAGDDPEQLISLLTLGVTDLEEPGHVSLYEDGSARFSLDCGFTLAGKSSVYEYPKKNIKVRFRRAYGQSELGYDLFGTGFGDYDSFILRAGQDSAYRLFNGEIWQDLCLEMSDAVMTQHSKYCIVYVNGEYFGIYCLKENISASLYADWAKVSKGSVEDAFTNDEAPVSYREMFYYITGNDMRDPANYQHACELLDMESFIDWLILEGVSGNKDLFVNVRLFRSEEAGGKYQLALFDLDGALDIATKPWTCLLGIAGYPNDNATKLLNALRFNDTFRASFLQRYGEVYDTVLSNEHILEKIDAYEALLRPEIQRDRDRWHYTVWQWETAVSEMKQIVQEMDWQQFCFNTLRPEFRISEEETRKYFSGS